PKSMKTRPFMSRSLRALSPLACGLMMAAMPAGPLRAASDAPPSPSSQTTRVDLTAGTNLQAAPVASGDPAATMFIDLTTGAAPTIMPARSVAAPTRTLHTGRVDLSNGASAPEQAEEDIAAPETTVITITADRLVDPYEETNRGRFRTHVALHHYVIDPVERVYVVAVPDQSRQGVHNFLSYLYTSSFH